MSTRCTFLYKSACMHACCKHLIFTTIVYHIKEFWFWQLGSILTHSMSQEVHHVTRNLCHVILEWLEEVRISNFKNAFVPHHSGNDYLYHVNPLLYVNPLLLSMRQV